MPISGEDMVGRSRKSNPGISSITDKPRPFIQEVCRGIYLKGYIVSFNCMILLPVFVNRLVFSLDKNITTIT